MSEGGTTIREQLLRRLERAPGRMLSLDGTPAPPAYAAMQPPLRALIDATPELDELPARYVSALFSLDEDGRFVLRFTEDRALFVYFDAERLTGPNPARLAWKYSLSLSGIGRGVCNFGALIRSILEIERLTGGREKLKRAEILATPGLPEAVRALEAGCAEVESSIVAWLYPPPPDPELVEWNRAVEAAVRANDTDAVRALLRQDVGQSSEHGEYR